MKTFLFGEEIEVSRTGTYPDMTLIRLLPVDTRFFVCSFDDTSVDFVPIMAVRNGMQKSFWIKREDIHQKHS